MAQKTDEMAQKTDDGVNEVGKNQSNVIENQTDVVENQTDVVENQTDVVELILSKLLESPNLSASELAFIIHKSQRQTQRIMSILKTKGIIRRIGPDKGGHWVVVTSDDHK